MKKLIALRNKPVVLVNMGMRYIPEGAMSRFKKPGTLVKPLFRSPNVPYKESGQTWRAMSKKQIELLNQG